MRTARFTPPILAVSFASAGAPNFSKQCGRHLVGDRRGGLAHHLGVFHYPPL
jgi:hypothetical protein